ncbi:hypothetical protein F5144DRAFT_647085 [Chaetomium tenue]|uniref:Uncharacterized protein n=1 Tax=Chaetomium tenue TaxID=1854479 RepID=A0ACB7PFP2_9PEZI|nr:hypothetical protein F5144DRAFT_647085 [Chaetomium globosum]
MSPTILPDMPSEAALQSLRDELDGNVFRGVDGFFAKYFENRPWSAALEEKLQETKAADKLSTDALGLTHFDALVEWLAAFGSLIFVADQSSLRFRTQSLSSTPTGPLSASIYIETSDLPFVAGSTRVFGEYHHADATVAVDDYDDLMRFYGRALAVFQAQPARLFLHGFRVCGSTLKLWVFDRSGAYSSGKLDLAQRPGLLVQTLASYAMMDDKEAGFNTFVKRLGPGSEGCVTFGQDNKLLHLRPELIAVPDYLVGLGTTCYAASTSTTGEPTDVVKFSWREGEAHAEIRRLEQARERKVWATADLRSGLQFPQPFVNRVFSCVATAPLGRPIQKFTSIAELLETLRDLVKALRSLYLDARIIHRDIAIKNLVIAPQSSADNPKGVLIDFDQALDVDNARAMEPMVGSDGFMAIGILTGKRHTYRHDLESLFYVFLWFAIANDHENDNAYDILEGLPKTSRLWKWCSMDFGAVGREKAADMTPEGFSALLDEFSADFAPLRGLAKELHAPIFSLRDGKIFTGTETDQAAVERLYDEMEDAFNKGASALQN